MNSLQKVLDFTKEVHKIKSNIYGDSWRKREWESIKCNFYRKNDALERLFSKSHKLQDLSIKEKTTILDNLLDMIVYCGLFTSFIFEKTSINDKKFIIDRIAGSLSVKTTDPSLALLHELLGT